ncbi:Rieske (2Fe-2S) protein [Roseinatronobacter sp. NSM]|uniref:Rieske (2Fe-2S) protein n=1 Tax=Roseinatronobacter sp. NSM TaxID=3457785 RepID=UPI0040367E48
MTDHVVCALSELPPGTAKRVMIGTRAIAVFNVDGKLSAIADRCPHEGASLSLGQVGGVIVADRPGEYRVRTDMKMVRCPWHGWEFDMETGKSWCDPARMKTRSFGVKICPGATLEEGTYRLEVFAVSLQDDYVVVTC